MMEQQGKKRMPQLVVDEVLLLVDTYFQCNKISDSTKKKLLVTKLSENMRSLPFFTEEKSKAALDSK